MRFSPEGNGWGAQEAQGPATGSDTPLELCPPRIKKGAAPQWTLCGPLSVLSHRILARVLLGEAASQEDGFPVRLHRSTELSFHSCILLKTFIYSFDT